MIDTDTCARCTLTIGYDCGCTEIERLTAERDRYKARAERAEVALQKIAGGKFIKDQALMHSAFECLLISRATLAQTDAEPVKPGPTLADAYRAGLEAAADELMVEALACEGSLSVETVQKAIRDLPVPPEFGGE